MNGNDPSIVEKLLATIKLCQYRSWGPATAEAEEESTKDSIEKGERDFETV